MTTLAQLVRKTRRYVRDYPDVDTAGASITSSGTALTVATDATQRYRANQRIEIDQEVILVKAAASTTSLTVARGVWDTTGASHANGATILVDPRFFWPDYVDAINSALDAMFPFFYEDVIDETIATSANTYEYDVPTVTSISRPIPYIYRLETLEPGDVAWRPLRNFRIVRGATPFIKLRYEPPANTSLRVYGIAPLAHLSATTDALGALFPYQGQDLIKEMAAGWLLGSGEAWRVRHDVGPIDSREQATRPGSSLAARRDAFQSFYSRLQAAAMPPPGKHLVPTY